MAPAALEHVDKAASRSKAVDAESELFPGHPGKRKHNTSPALIIVMGVSGCGKSTVGEAIAKKFRLRFVDGDSLHPKSNIEKMSKGIPLNDDDRTPWLNIIRKEAAKLTTRESLKEFYDGNNLKDPQQPRAGIVIACSALKRSYRDMLRGTTGEKDLDRGHDDLETFFVFLNGSRQVLLDRMQARKNHFFAAKMLDSQLETLEQPSEQEEKTQGVIEVDIEHEAEQVIVDACKKVTERVGFVEKDEDQFQLEEDEKWRIQEKLKEGH